jgi:hypothetical protein
LWRGATLGYWAAWCQLKKWVERAENHDDLIDEARRSAAAERRRKLQDERSRFEEDEQQRIQHRVRNIDEVLDRAGTASFTEVTQVKRDEVTGKRTTTKIRPPNLRDLAALTETRNKTARQAVLGVYDIKDLEKAEREIERVVWRQKKKAA